jgi:SEFIR domain
MKELKDVFVTYSWGDKAHEDQVLAFTNELRENGFNAEMDKLISQRQTATDFDKMMHKIMTDYKKVIIVLSEGYKQKAENFSKSVGKEYSYIIKTIDDEENKFVFVCFRTLSNDIVPHAIKGREVIDFSIDKGDAFNNLFAKLKDENLIDFSEVAKEKPVIVKKSIPTFSIIPEEESIISSNPEIFFIDRLTKAFPGVYDLKIFDDKSLMKRLSELLEEPTSFQKAKGYQVYTDPIGWTRGCTESPIDKFKIIKNNRCLIQLEELDVVKIAVYRSRFKGKSFVYIESKSLPPTGLQNVDSVTTEEYADFNGIPIRGAEYDDGFAEINGEFIKLEGKAEIRIRHLTDSNMLICAKSSCYKDLKNEVLIENLLVDILKGTKTLKDLIEFSANLNQPKLGNELLGDIYRSLT